LLLIRSHTKQIQDLIELIGEDGLVDSFEFSIAFTSGVDAVVTHILAA
jgi:hypothetical protein